MTALNYLVRRFCESRTRRGRKAAIRRPRRRRRRATTNDADPGRTARSANAARNAASRRSNYCYQPRAQASALTQRARLRSRLVIACSKEAASAVLDPQYAELAELAGGFIHEIKNHLSTLGLNLQLLAEDFEDPQSQRERRALERVSASNPNASG